VKALTALLLAAAAAPAGLIVAGERIGPAALGMSPAQLSRAASTIQCPEAPAVQALFRDGKAVQLQTNCGGALLTPAGAQVGALLATALREFGYPDSTAASRVYSFQDGRTALATWHIYRVGIAFRTVRPTSEPEWRATVTCISVFRPAAAPVLGDTCFPQQPQPEGR
jgi:hypothetical protein